MKRIFSILKFISWPTACGILLAISFLQYQQLQRLSVAPAPTAQDDIATPGNLSFSEAIKSAAPSVVSINATSYNVESVELAADDTVNFLLGERASLGSGVIVSETGFILTNLHVVDSSVLNFAPQVTLSDGRSSSATIIAWDKENDLAVLHVNMDDLAPIQIGSEQELEVGDIVFAIGYPRNIGQSVSQGIISALSRNPDTSATFIQTDAAINPGNSGGALINSQGELVGINSSIFSESGNFEGIGFATPASLAISVFREMADEAIANNSGYLGVITGEALDAQSSTLFFGVDHIRGMLVESVDSGGPAERAGIQPGDVITRVGETPVIDSENIILEIRNKKPGESIEIEVYREGQAFLLPTILGFGQAIVIGP